VPIRPAPAPDVPDESDAEEPDAEEHETGWSGDGGDGGPGTGQRPGHRRREDRTARGGDDDSSPASHLVAAPPADRMGTRQCKRCTTPRGRRRVGACTINPPRGLSHGRGSPRAGAPRATWPPAGRLC